MIDGFTLIVDSAKAASAEEQVLTRKFEMNLLQSPEEKRIIAEKEHYRSFIKASEEGPPNK